MLSIDDNNIRISRGDAGNISFSIPISDSENYEFEAGETLQFRVFQKNGYDKDCVFEKEITVTETTEEVLIPLTVQDTLIGEPINKPVEYWYEIDLNNEQTVIGYDEKPSKLILLPAKGGE